MEVKILEHNSSGNIQTRGGVEERKTLKHGWPISMILNVNNVAQDQL